MSDPPTTSGKDFHPHRPNPGWTIWLGFAAGGAVFAVAVALAAVHLPASVKLLGLFGAAFGAAVGWGLAKLAIKLQLRRGVEIFAIIGILVIASQVTLAVETHRLYAGELKRRESVDLSDALAERMLSEAQTPDDEGAAQYLEDMRQAVADKRQTRESQLRRQASFFGYLQYRLSPIGELTPVMATILWCLEVFLGGATGIAAAVMTLGPTTLPRENRQEQTNA